MADERTTYHHGDLARAMVDVAVELADAGGPSAVVLREVARRIGVTPAAAYRHFRGQRALLAAVGQRAMDGMAEAMLERQRVLPPHANAEERAELRWRATGEGYVQFAVDHPGLFRTAFAALAATPVPPTSVAGASAARSPASPPNPYELLTDALDECVTVGLISPERRAGADQLSWIAVHGLSVLAIDGYLPSRGPEFDHLVQRTLDLFHSVITGR